MAHIELKNVHLSYPIYGTGARDFKSSLISMATGGAINKEKKIIHVDALTDISFSLKCGDRVGLIGHNGAGKSTLLKLLAKVYHPTTGHLKIQGKSSCIFDIMMGMDPELNGFENIILRSRIAGLNKIEAKELTENVEEFCQLGQYMSMPFKTYSAGMQLRLAFGIITNIRADILLIDEILNVGDAEFAKKASNQIKNLVNNAEILVVSTHDLQKIENLCNKAIWLENGHIKEFGHFENIIKLYQNTHG